MTRVGATILLEVDNGQPVLRPRGYYSDSETHVYTNEFRDYVLLDSVDGTGNRITHYFIVRKFGDEIKGVPPVPGDKSPNRRWEESSKIEFIVANSITADMINSDSIFSLQMNVNNKFIIGPDGIMHCVDGIFSGSIYTLPFHVTNDNFSEVIKIETSGQAALANVLLEKTGLNVQIDCAPLPILICLPRELKYEGAEASLTNGVIDNRHANLSVECFSVNQATYPWILSREYIHLGPFQTVKLKCIVAPPSADYPFDLVDEKAVEWVLLNKLY